MYLNKETRDTNENKYCLFLTGINRKKREKHSMYLQNKVVQLLFHSLKKEKAHPFTEIEVAACLMKRLMLDTQEKYCEENLSVTFADFMESLKKDIIEKLPIVVSESFSCSDSNNDV